MYNNITCAMSMSVMFFFVPFQFRFIIRVILGILVSVPPLICAGFACCHCTGRWAVLDNTHGKDSCAFR